MGIEDERKMIVDPFSNRDEAGKLPETIAEVEAGIDEKVERMLELYNRLKTWDTVPEYLKYQTEKGILKVEYEALTPQQMNILLKRMIKKTDREKIDDELTGRFISLLMQKSYDNGHNDFFLSTDDTHIDCIGCKLIGTGDNNIRATVEGNVGEKLGYKSEMCKYTINGNTKDKCGEGSKYCRYEIEGNTGEWCGWVSSDNTYKIGGDAEDLLGCGVRRCEFTIGGKVGTGIAQYATACTYRMADEKAYMRIKKGLEEGNLIQKSMPGMLNFILIKRRRKKAESKQPCIILQLLGKTGEVREEYRK